MKAIVVGCLLLVSVLLPGLAQATVEGFARISLVQGEVQVQDAESREWLPAGVNTPLEEGDSIWSPAGSRVEIQFRNGTYLRLEGRTIVDLVDMEIDQQRVHVASGRLYVKTGSRADDLQVDWGDASVLVERKTRLKVDLLANGDEEVAILKGAASVESAGGRTRVRGGETMTLHEYRGAHISPLRPVDEWERWNAKRDKQLTARKRAEYYLPEELVIYEDELAGNGDWVVVEEYGYVWRPRVSVSVDWAPYRHGRWVWRGGDYVWITSEPWGWVPYHYGRWAMVPGRGWCWVPPTRGDVFWGPGYVAWVNTSSHVGWVPLAPREVYYGRGHYGRHSIDISRHEHRPTNISYRNVTINNSITIVSRDGFARGTGRHEVARENPFRHSQAVVHRPDIRPVNREARMPVVKPVAVSAPPPPIAQRPPARDLRERYPLLRQERQRERGIQPERRQEATVAAPVAPERRNGNVAPVVTPAPHTPSAPSAPAARGGESDMTRDRRQTGLDPKPVPPGGGRRQEVVPHQERRGPEPKAQEPRPASVVHSPPATTVEREEIRPQRGGEVRDRGPRRSWRVETKEAEPKTHMREEKRGEQAGERHDRRHDRRRRDE